MIGSTPKLDAKEIKRLSNLAVPDFNKRMKSYLVALAGQSPELNDDISYHHPSLIAAAYCSSIKELRVITQYLEEEKMLRPNKSRQRRANRGCSRRSASPC